MSRCLPAAFLALLWGLPLGAQTLLPTGFAEDTVVAGLDLPIGFAFLPDGRQLIAEQRTGRVIVHASGAVATVLSVAGLNLNQNDRGVQGIAVDPSWPQWPYVYLHYTHGSGSIRVTRYTASGSLSDRDSTNLSFGSPKTILSAPDSHPFHNGGSLRFGPDGMLYLSLGDDVRPCDAQNPEILRGCILRLDMSSLYGDASPTAPSPSTIAAAGNPFSGPNAQMVWCQGLRNPFRFSIDSLSGHLFIADVGAGSREALYESSGGENYGWPFVEGSLGFQSCAGPTPTITDPIAEYAHAAFSYQSIVAMGRYRQLPGRPLGFGGAYDGELFYVDYYGGEVKRLSEASGTWAPAPAAVGQPTPTSWAAGLDSVSDARWGPDGALYYTSHQGGALKRIRGNATLASIHGDGLPGNAGSPLTEDLVAELRDSDGFPVAGATVTFHLVSGSATILQPTETSDALGRVSCSLSLGLIPGDIVVEARAAGLSTTFNVPWRGMTIDFDPLTITYTVTVHHSEAGSPITVASDIPRPTSMDLGFGEIQTGILSPTNTLGLIDGIGLVNSPEPIAVTGSDGTWTLISPPVPPSGGIVRIYQAYALDSPRLPHASAYMISNAILLTLP